jgi:DNA-binding NtrC family response regulator
MIQAKLLIIEDDQKMRRLLELILRQEGYEIITSSGGAEGIKKLQDNPCDLILTDLQMEKMDGMQVLDHVKKNHPGIPVLITGYGTVKTAVEAMQRGALDYITKPIDNEELKLIIRRALEVQNITLENKTLSQGIKRKFSFESIIGNSPPLFLVKKLAEEVSNTGMTVLITGESGTGKELLAQAIHYRSDRSRFSMVPINCAAIPETLLESELFGYEKGAFTDAKISKPGRILLGNKGTIFLDEISEISPRTQVKLLRVLQEREIEPLGSTQPVKVDVRIIAATNKDLMELIKQEKFREDLYYRLNVFPLHLPPLRERKGDVRILAEHFLEKFNIEMGKRFKHFSEEALRILDDYPWPGNIRELQNTVERVLLTCKGEVVEPEDLPDNLGQILSNLIQPPSLLSLGLSIEDIEKRVIEEALEKTQGNVSDASRLLGVTRNTLRYRIQKYGLQG